MRKLVMVVFILLWIEFATLMAITPLTAFQGFSLIAIVYALTRISVWLALNETLTKMKGLADATIIVLNANRARIEELESKTT
jgi:hypothetical protein